MEGEDAEGSWGMDQRMQGVQARTVKGVRHHGLLLQGATLIEAETYFKDYDNLGLLDGIAQEYIEVSQTVRDRRILLEELERERKQREMRNPLSRFLGFFRKSTISRSSSFSSTAPATSAKVTLSPEGA